MEFSIKINHPNEAGVISKIANRYDGSIDIKSKDYHYIVDAKSMLGILSLDLSNKVVVSCNDKDTFENLKEDLKEFAVK